MEQLWSSNHTTVYLDHLFFLFEYTAGPSRPVQEWYRNVMIKKSWGKVDTENVIQKSYRNVMKRKKNHGETSIH